MSAKLIQPYTASHTHAVFADVISNARPLVQLFDFRPQRPRAVGEVDGGLGETWHRRLRLAVKRLRRQSPNRMGSSIRFNAAHSGLYRLCRLGNLRQERVNCAGQPAVFVNVARMPHAGFARNLMCPHYVAGTLAPPGAWIDVRWECRIGAACHCDSFVCHLFVCKTSHCAGIHRSFLTTEWGQPNMVRTCNECFARRRRRLQDIFETGTPSESLTVEAGRISALITDQ